MMKNISDIKGIIFDYGGTIDSRGDHWSHVIEKAYHDAGYNISHEGFRQAYIIGERTLGKKRIIMPTDNFHNLLKKKIEIQVQQLVELQELTPMQAWGDDIPAVAKVAKLCYQSAKQCVQEAEPVLKALSEKYPMVLVSNFYGNVEEVLRDFGIRKYFRGIIESAVVGVRKPDPKIFMLGAVALGLDPKEVLVVGDSYKKDILPAREIGCATAWIKGRGWTEEENLQEDDAEIPSLNSLLELLHK